MLCTLATWGKGPTHWKRPWCWGRLKAGGEGDNRGWTGGMASPTLWIWVWVNTGSWWRTGRPGVLQSMGSQRAGHDWVTAPNIHRAVRMITWADLYEAWGIVSVIWKGNILWIYLNPVNHQAGATRAYHTSASLNTFNNQVHYQLLWQMRTVRHRDSCKFPKVSHLQ